jgi:hypothetical protein
MQGVLDASRGAHRGEDGFRVGGREAGVESGLNDFGGAFLSMRRPMTAASESRPPAGVTLGEPAGVGDAADALVDSAMAGVGLDGARVIGAKAVPAKSSAASSCRLV